MKKSSRQQTIALIGLAARVDNKAAMRPLTRNHQRVS
jgi:hypothetical protein